jgi:hypothetical protein
MVELVHRCMVYFNMQHYRTDGGPNLVGLVSEAYGRRPERKYIEAAINDMVVLRALSMKYTGVLSPFFTTVVSYPKGGDPPDRVERQMYWQCDGADD